MSITVKVLNAKKVLNSYKLEQGSKIILQGKDKVNYQLIDDATGFAPQNIIAKRVGSKLEILLDDGDTSSDIVIENYYGAKDPEQVTNLIVGKAENGLIYAYVPESGEKNDAVSLLVDNEAAPQALGGEEISPYWAFNPWWLLALVPLAGIAIAAGNHDGSGSSSSTD
ncbi:cell wall anchor protein, partial [Avibacterium sp. 20-129]|nr:cell wall anchor protein [Avibacterium sp. 20-129]